MRVRPSIAVVVLVALAAAACTDDDAPSVEVAEVRSDTVVQSVAAAARLEPAARAQVRAPLGGAVEELLVADGDVVEAGAPLVRLTSDSLAAQVEQAETAVVSARRLGDAAEGAGLDLAPVLGAFRTQLDTVFPPLIDSLGSQLSTAQSTLAATIAGVEETTRAAGEFRQGVESALRDAERTLVELDDLAREVTPDTDALRNRLEPDLDALPDGAALPDGTELPDLELPEIDLPEVPSLDLDLPSLPPPPDSSGVSAALREAQRSAAQAGQQLASTREAFGTASGELREAEEQLRAQTEQSSAAQAAAVEAQVAQAEAALEAVQARTDDLLVLAPIAGVVELARGASDAAPLPGTDGLEGLGDVGLGGEGLEGLGDLDGLLGGAGDGSSVSGPLAEGVEVGAGQSLLTLFDLSGFTAMVEVDELDVVEVEEGQPVVVRVDAYPGVELEGRVEHVALAPSRDVIGGSLYPVTVSLLRVPEEVRLRVGLTAAAEIEVRRLDAELVVPTSALLRRGDAEVVHVVRDGVAVEVPVGLLAIGDTDAAVEGDLEVGEQVVTVGVELISDGDEVPT